MGDNAGSICRRKLTTEQVSYLAKPAWQNEYLEALTISNEKDVTGSPVAIELLRERLNELVARIGFDDEYRLTKDGEMIESIIEAGEPYTGRIGWCKKK